MKSRRPNVITDTIVTRTSSPYKGSLLMVGLLLLAGIALELMAGGLQAFQTAALTMALPFCLVLLVMCVSLLKAFSQERP